VPSSNKMPSTETERSEAWLSWLRTIWPDDAGTGEFGVASSPMLCRGESRRELPGLTIVYMTESDLYRFAPPSKSAPRAMNVAPADRGLPSLPVNLQMTE